MGWENIIKMKRVGSGPQTTIHLTMEEMNKLMEDAKSVMQSYQYEIPNGIGVEYQNYGKVMKLIEALKLMPVLDFDGPDDEDFE